MSAKTSPVIRHGALVFLLLAGFSMTGCSDGTPIMASTNPADYVGEYVLTPSDGTHVQFADFLILRTDQTAVGIRFSKETEQVLTTKSKWSLDHTNVENVVIGDFSYPVEHVGLKTTLSVNDDLNLHYEKIR
jgi:hypothetical protein